MADPICIKNSDKRLKQIENDMIGICESKASENDCTYYMAPQNIPHIIS